MSKLTTVLKAPYTAVAATVRYLWSLVPVAKTDVQKALQPFADARTKLLAIESKARVQEQRLRAKANALVSAADAVAKKAAETRAAIDRMAAIIGA